MGKKISKLGLALVIVNSVIVVFFSYTDTMNAIQVNSSGFALIPMMMVDFPASYVALYVYGFSQQFFQCPLTNTASIINNYYIVRGSICAVSFLIFGGLQWYFVGWLISKIKQKFFTRSKIKKLSE